MHEWSGPIAGQYDLYIAGAIFMPVAVPRPPGARLYIDGAAKRSSSDMGGPHRRRIVRTKYR